MPKGRLVFDGDNVYTQKDARIYKLKSSVSSKIDAIPGVVDSLDSTSSTDALSANMGKELQDQITELSGVGTFLSTWDCTTGLPNTNPQEDPYTYKIGNYYIVANVATGGGTNYKPHGATYTQGVASTAIETDVVSINDWYLYDGANWVRQPAGDRQISIDSSLSTVSTNAVENRVVTNALNGKQNTISDLSDIRSGAAAGATALQALDNITELTNNAGYQTAGDVAAAIAQLAPDGVGAGVLTLQKNSSTLDTFSANATQNKTINISVPTTVAELSDANDYATKSYVDGSVIHTGSTAPSNPSEGMLWYDTTNDELKVYDGTNWNLTGKVYSAGTGISINSSDEISNTGVLSVNGQSGAITGIATEQYVDSAASKYVGPTEPDTPVEGMFWYDTTNDILKVYNGSSWTSIQELLINGVSIKTVNNHDLLGSGNIDIIGVEEIQFVTQTEYDNLPASKTSDSKAYFIYSGHGAAIVSDEPFSSSWDGITTQAPSKNAIYDVLGDVNTLLANI